MEIVLEMRICGKMLLKETVSPCLPQPESEPGLLTIS